MKDQHIIPIIIGIAMLLTGCSFLKSAQIGGSSSAEINELVPNTEITLDVKRENAADMCSFLKASYEKMQELAAADGASPDGIKAAKEVEEQYADRLNELFALDFSAMDESDIDSYLIEMTNLITVIREARDALTLG